MGGHRKGVLDVRYDTVGVAYGPHCTFGQMAAMEFARGWEPDADAVRHWGLIWECHAISARDAKK